MPSVVCSHVIVMPSAAMQSVIMLNVVASFEMNEGGNYCFFWFKRVLDWGPEQRESNLTVLCLLGWWSVALGEKLQCRGLRPLYEGSEHGGSSVEEGTACRSAFGFVFGSDGVDGRHYWWPCGLFLDFSPRRKILENRLPHGRNGNSEMIVFYYFSYWIGLTDIQTEGTFAWNSTCTPLTWDQRYETFYGRNLRVFVFVNQSNVCR